MREILFRGMLSLTKKWIEGNLIISNQGKPYIYPKDLIEQDGHHLIFDTDEAFWVIPETVGEFTGLLDKNNVRIFEGDLLRKPSKDQYEETSFVLFEVFYHDENMCDSHIGWQFNRLHFQGNICGHSGWERFRPEYTGNMVVVGNIYDNKDLLERIGTKNE